jgi:hypothetical protein
MYANVSILFNHLEDLTMYLLSSAWIVAILYFSLDIAAKHVKHLKLDKRKAIIHSTVFSLLINLLMLQDSGWLVLIYILVSPVAIVLLANAAFGINGKNVLSSVGEYLRSGYARMTGVLFLFLLITFFGLIFIISPLSYISIWLMEMNVELSDKTYTLVLQFFMMFAFIVLMTFTMVFYATQCIFLSFSIHEIADARGLLSGIEKMGQSRKAYGIETE